MLAQLASRISGIMMKFGTATGEDPFARVKGLITELISQLQKEAFEDDTAKHSSTLETAVSRSILSLRTKVTLTKSATRSRRSDRCLPHCDAKCKIACETCVKDNMFMVAGEITVAGKMDDCDELIPEWLNFVKDVVDSEDLPLNIYREILQQNKILRVIKKNHVMKCMDMFDEIAELSDDRKKFYEQFVKCVKLGIRENSVDDLEIAELLRFNTSKSGDEQISFKEHVDRMKEGQNDNYHIKGESIAVVFPSSLQEHLRKKGHEVLRVATRG